MNEAHWKYRNPPVSFQQKEQLLSAAISCLHLTLRLTVSRETHCHQLHQLPGAIGAEDRLPPTIMWEQSCRVTGIAWRLSPLSPWKILKNAIRWTLPWAWNIMELTENMWSCQQTTVNMTSKTSALHRSHMFTPSNTRVGVVPLEVNKKGRITGWLGDNLEITEIMSFSPTHMPM